MEKYFAAANSGHGFVSRFDNIFDPMSVDYTYIIKGGSGTGKSTLMKKAAAKAERMGCTCEYFYCSSDVSSLDGIIITHKDGRTVGMLDGTAPHTRDPKYPGICDEIINLGDFWDTALLQAQKSKLIALTNKKSELYREAYKCFGTAETLYRAQLHESGELLIRKKLDGAVMRLLTKRMRECHIKQGSGRVRIRGLSALSTSGAVSFDSYDTSELIYTVIDAVGTSPFLFDSLISTANTLGLSYDIAPIPLAVDIYEAIRFPELDMAIVSHTSRKDVRVINMSRFVDRDALHTLERSRRRSITKGIQELTENGLSKLSEVRGVHESIEKIYISAMDFTRLEVYTRELIKKISI